MADAVSVADISIGEGHPLVLIAGPCVIEDAATTLAIADFLKKMSRELEIPVIFKASYDKANRTSLEAFRGPGITAGLEILKRVKTETGLQILSDVHGMGDISEVAEVLDVIQIPAFLCRQTDLLLAAAATKKPINLKKGQFMAPWDMVNALDKIKSSGNRQIMITERGAMFGYNNLVVDFRGIKIMQDTGFPVVFDATHSVQIPGGAGTSSGGQREFAPLLAKAAVAAGVNALFMEVHPDPDRALCDGPNSLVLDQLPYLVEQLKAIRSAIEN
jgi:2-dehydro-3-deoxyphosphooctonate aldolase (KDO 8-P synthase)